jgi:zinc transport system permease protein
MWEIMHFEFMQNALMAGLLVGITCGIIGTLVVVNRLVFLSGGIAHAAYGGIGVALISGLPYIAGTLGVSLAAAFVMAVATLKAKHRADTIIGVIWAVGMASGIILIDLTPGYNVDLMSYLFGSILTVPRADLWQMLAICVSVLVIVIYYYYDFLAMSYDDEFARLRNVPVKWLYFLLLGMIALSVVMIIRVVGLILVIALLTIPPYIAEKYTRSLHMMMVVSIVLSCLFIAIGLGFSYLFNLTSGATIILVAALGFIISPIVEGLMPKRHPG